MTLESRYGNILMYNLVDGKKQMEDYYKQIEFIINSQSYDDVRESGMMPEPRCGDDYYFVSYSHADYKQVFCVIVELQSRGLPLWYDRGLETGTSWLKDVTKHLISYRCKGVIFFLSESFIASESVQSEVLRTYKRGTRAVFIDYTGGKAEELIAKVKNEKVKNAFAILMSRSAIISSESSVDDIVAAVSAIPKPPLLKFRFDNDIDDIYESPVAALLNVADRTVKTVEVPVFVMARGKKYVVAGVESEALAGCSYLESVVMPHDWTYIDAYAFHNCTRLQSIELGNPAKKCEAKLDLMAFNGCTALKRLEIPCNVTITKVANFLCRCAIEEIAFVGGNEMYEEFPHVLSFTENLKRVINMPKCKKISQFSFNGCTKLETVAIPSCCESIEFCAFVGCSALSNLSFPQSLKEVGAYAFFGCHNFTDVVFTGVDTNIGIGAFAQCVSVKRILAVGEKFKLDCGAFAACRCLEEVSLNCKCIEIDESAFAQCPVKTVVVGGEIVRGNISGKFKSVFDADTYEVSMLPLTPDDRIPPALETIFPCAVEVYVACEAPLPIMSADFLQYASDRDGYFKFVKEKS